MEEPKIVSRHVDFKPFDNKNEWTTEYSDGLIERNEYPTFINQCNMCPKLINSKDAKNRCGCGALICPDCQKECKKLGTFYLTFDLQYGISAW